jgi:hypothetical protein
MTSITSKYYRDNLQSLTEWNMSHGQYACKSKRFDIRIKDKQRVHILRPCHNAKYCFTCHLYGDGMVKAMKSVIWRTMSNLRLHGVPLFWITISLDSPLTADGIDNNSELRQAWSKVIDKTKRVHADMQYFKLTVGASEPHIHCVSTHELEGINGLDIDSQLIGSTADDISKVVNYLGRNMKELAPFVSSRVSKSNDFKAWSTPDIFYMLHSPVDIYSTFDQHGTRKVIVPTLRECRKCDNKLPLTSQYFNRSNKRFRYECKKCWQVTNAAIKMNLRTSHGKQATRDTVLALRAMQSDDNGTLYDYYDGTPREYYELTVDHKISVKNGGTNAIENLCLTTRKNNNDKGSMTYSAWLATLYAKGIDHADMPKVIPPHWTRQMQLFKV